MVVIKNEDKLLIQAFIEREALDYTNKFDCVDLNDKPTSPNEKRNNWTQAVGKKVFQKIKSNKLSVSDIVISSHTNMGFVTRQLKLEPRNYKPNAKKILYVDLCTCGNPNHMVKIRTGSNELKSFKDMSE